MTSRAFEKSLPALRESFNFLNMDELRQLSNHLGLPFAGQKGEVIQRIVHFLETGENKERVKLPKISCARAGESYPLMPGTLILKGAYKNNDETRAFMKSLVGEHFHFTSFGQDWIKNRWLRGKPPSYQEFADSQLCRDCLV